MNIITKYIKDKTNSFKEKFRIVKFLKQHNISKYKINDDFSVDVFQSVSLFGRRLNEIPVQFGIVHGDFTCTNNNLTSLKGCPGVVKGDFSCDGNELTSLKYSPEIVEGRFYCVENKITSLEYITKDVKALFCMKNKITSLEHCPNVETHIHCEYNMITSFEHFPKTINGDLLCDYNIFVPIKDLAEFDIKVKGEIHVDEAAFPMLAENFRKDKSSLLLVIPGEVMAEMTEKAKFRKQLEAELPTHNSPTKRQNKI